MKGDECMKHKFTVRKHMIQICVMCFLVLAMSLTVIKITSDYHEAEGFSKEVNPANPTEVTASPTPTVTVSSGTSVVVMLNYMNETIKVSKGAGDSTKLYFSQDKKKTWNLIEDSYGEMDLAIFMKTSDNMIYFKGDKDLAIVEIEIPKEDKNLKVSYYVENGKGKLKFENRTRALQYRKGTNGEWKDYITDLDLSDFEITGYTLQFREKATVTMRASKVVSVKIPKRQSTPSIKVDYSDFTLNGLKPEVTQYRLSGSLEWITFNPTDSKNKSLSLVELLLPKNTEQNTLPIPARSIEFRTLGNEKKVSSGVLVVEINAQPLAPDVSNIKLSGTTLSFKDASKTRPYEYLVVHAGDTIDYKTAKWEKVTSSKDLVIKKIGTATPIPGDIIYCRLASTTDKDTKVATLASMYVKIPITSIVSP